eukprot:gnl/MRDRNA2_/MRDRNA2_122660_c0_seq1.p1 gnl/MRDRNA2_/MRDRNA2_122660_c0~~gnl/MRDRNA2_/MRDRNA2_122660_c0_seq1.p1  ORF type:complete len:524 (-),score=84.88 gnl/MRDRNA2_/MRDRNA2_122660_c0_seq1:13-1584(-)
MASMTMTIAFCILLVLSTVDGKRFASSIRVGMDESNEDGGESEELEEGVSDELDEAKEEASALKESANSDLAYNEGADDEAFDFENLPGSSYEEGGQKAGVADSEKANSGAGETPSADFADEDVHETMSTDSGQTHFADEDYEGMKGGLGDVVVDQERTNKPPLQDQSLQEVEEFEPEKISQSSLLGIQALAAKVNQSSLQEFQPLASSSTGQPEACTTSYPYYRTDKKKHEIYSGGKIFDRLDKVYRRLWHWWSIKSRCDLLKYMGGLVDEQCDLGGGCGLLPPKRCAMSELAELACDFMQSPSVRFKQLTEKYEKDTLVAPLAVDATLYHVYSSSHKQYNFEPIVRNTAIVMWATGKDDAYTVMEQDSKNILRKFTKDLAIAAKNQVNMASIAIQFCNVISLLDQVNLKWGPHASPGWWKASFRWQRPRTGGNIQDIVQLRKKASELREKAKQNRNEIRMAISMLYEALGPSWDRMRAEDRGKYLRHHSNDLNGKFKRLGAALRALNRHAHEYSQFADLIL